MISPEKVFQILNVGPYSQDFDRFQSKKYAFSPQKIHFQQFKNLNIFRLRRAIFPQKISFIASKTPKFFACSGPTRGSLFTEVFPDSEFGGGSLFTPKNLPEFGRGVLIEGGGLYFQQGGIDHQKIVIAKYFVTLFQKVRNHLFPQNVKFTQIISKCSK